MMQIRGKVSAMYEMEGELVEGRKGKRRHRRKEWYRWEIWYKEGSGGIGGKCGRKV